MKLTVNLKNKGKFTIWDLKGFGADNLNLNFGTDGLVPGEVSSDVYIIFCKTDSDNEIEIASKIKIDDKEGYCSENTLIINDNTLNSIPPST